MDKSFLIVVISLCLIVLTASAVDYIDNKNELLVLEIQEKKLSIELLQMQLIPK